MPPPPRARPNPFHLENPAILDLAPPAPKSVEETGLGLAALAELALKQLHPSSASTGGGAELAARLHLPWPGVVERVVDFLAGERWVEVRGARGAGRAPAELALTEAGRAAGHEALARSSYVGAAPVPLAQYSALMEAQAGEAPVVSREELSMGLSHLSFSPALLEGLGPAVSAARSLLLYGPPGNGRTSLAEAIGRLLTGEAYVPHALEVDGHLIRLLDSLHHTPVSLEGGRDASGRRQTFEMDARWRLCRRPVVVVGAELGVQSLDLVYSPRAGFYEAPLGLKANGGMLLVDDLGRQRLHPADLLQRLGVPLEKQRDFLTLHTGQRVEVPFDAFVVFSTHLEPKSLLDEAFLRRIPYKLEVGSPDERTWRDIFSRVCEAAGIPYVDQAVTYLLEHIYRPRNLPLRACHPRHLVALVKDAARYRQVPPALSKELLDHACQVFFVER